VVAAAVVFVRLMGWKIDLNAMHEHADEDNKFMALTRQERVEDLLDLLKV